MSAMSKNPSGYAYGLAKTAYAKEIAAQAAGADVGTDADPYVLMICNKPTRVYGGRLVARDTPEGVDGSNTIVAKLRAISAAGAVLGTICSATKTTSPAAVVKLPASIDLTESAGPDPTYWDIPEGGGIGLVVTQGATADLWHTGAVDVYLCIATADDSNLSN